MIPDELIASQPSWMKAPVEIPEQPIADKFQLRLANDPTKRPPILVTASGQTSGGGGDTSPGFNLLAVECSGNLNGVPALCILFAASPPQPV